MFFLCSVYTLTEKTAIYATLVGILNAKKYDIGEEVSDTGLGGKRDVTD